MITKDVKQDLFLLFCSFLFYFAFLILNLADITEGSKENRTYNDYDEPPERCYPNYENRLFRDGSNHASLKCVKISVPDIEIYDRSCEELNLTNPDFGKECIIE